MYEADKHPTQAGILQKGWNPTTGGGAFHLLPGTLIARYGVGKEIL